MLRRRSLLAAFCALLMGTGSGQAQRVADPPGRYATIGGGVSCEDWGSVRRSEDTMGRLEAWILGFLSGVGWTASNGYNPLQGMAGGDVLAWVDRYCSGHPLSDLGDAATAFVVAHPR